MSGDDLPKAGDATICYDCMAILIFTGDLALRRPSYEEEESDAFEPLRHARALLLAIRADGPPPRGDRE